MNQSDTHRVLRWFYRAMAVVPALLSISCAATNTSQGVGPLSGRQLRERFRTDKKEYLVAEPIFVTQWLENTGSQTEYYHRKDLWDFALFDEHGTRMEFRGTIFEPELIRPYPKSDYAPIVGFKPLNPGESTPKGTINLLNYYGNGGAKHGLDFYLRPGSYYIVATRLLSDTAKIDVVEPTTPEDKAAMQLLVDEADNFFGPQFGTPQLRFEYFSDFVDKYPNSVYTPCALSRILFMTDVDTTVSDYAKNQYYARYMITHFPQSGFAYRALFALDPANMNPQERSGIMQGLRILRSKLEPYEDLRKRADELIGKLEK